ncbi:GerMN domain-containing protein [Myceligenerans pegani]|uniref:GerMN domain-containing protein n=1 Tax=Myceligenerans pegani TaxID=2776917 RepID=A0ABR9N514_9MICO|nr:GerMN domain-containing protein [Myceligenerans sp. TRM 65318]MBE1878440.1 GerMN domain-containing protein [Myceligenerans sp. TRM 65318]MBE3020711.1 GerMN domain-containing protein [Myceligenerans sp. TRM 65318]
MSESRPAVRRATHRRRWAAVVTAAVAMGAALVPLGAHGAVGQDRGSDAQHQARLAFLASPIVTEFSESTRVARVDVSKDPRVANEWLEESADVMDGWTIVVGGFEVEPGAERRAADEAVGNPGAPGVAGAAPVCPDIPQGSRSTDGSTTPDLGCDLATGERRTGEPSAGEPSDTLATAVDDTLSALLPDADLAPAKVRLVAGAATVDVATGFDDALADGAAHPSDVWQALLFTAHSNGAVDSVTFTLDGDCLAFAYASGGDMCVATTLPIELD